MDGFKGGYRLELDDNLLLHQQVDPIGAFDRSTEVTEGNGALTLEMQTTLSELQHHAGLISGFQ